VALYLQLPHSELAASVNQAAVNRQFKQIKMANTSNEERDTKPGNNQDKQGVDKAPGEEQNKGEQVTTADLKGKKVDADPTQESDKPADQ
jgi:hypothetical protein